MDRISKTLQVLTAKERAVVAIILKKLKDGNTNGLNIKKLKGRDDIFRVRKGQLRIIYRIENDSVFLISISRRREDTYRL